MTIDKIKTLKQMIEKSKEKLNIAKLLLEHNAYDDTVSRSYYAVFHIIQAVILL